ncbi:phosphotransferase [Brevibacterium litoralis]|uniref:phosphotransferase n=1 Tax=Brevibacterium litoralis TaxID=3138935 RepID=UPI0032EF073B
MEPLLQNLFVPGWVEAHLGPCTTVDHLRYKPGQSVLGRVHRSSVETGDTTSTTGPPAPGWFSVRTAAHRAKAEKTCARARAAGIAVHRADLPDGGLLTTGPIGADRRLGGALRQAGLVAADGTVRGRVLNYNPGRRLVVEAGSHPDPAVPPGEVWRTWATPPGTVAAVCDLALRVPVVLASRPVAAATVAVPRVFGGDLADHLCAGTAPTDWPVRVAAAAADLHAARPTDLLAASVPSSDRATVREALVAVGRTLGVVCPEAHQEYGDLAAAVLDALGPDFDGDTVLLHGDLSADQVLGWGPGTDPDAVRLIDLDRLRWGPAGYDLGCFRAVELLSGRGNHGADRFLEAYASTTGSSVARPGAWTAFHVLLRVLDPFRAADPDHPHGIAERLALAALCLDEDRHRSVAARTRVGV